MIALLEVVVVRTRMLVLSSYGGGMLWFVGGGVVKFCDHADDVTWHVDVDPAFFVVLV